MCADRREVLKAFAAQPTSLVQLSGTVFEQHVFFEVVPLFEADQTDETNVGTLVGMRAYVIAEVGVLCERLMADWAAPLRSCRVSA